MFNPCADQLHQKWANLAMGIGIPMSHVAKFGDAIQCKSGTGLSVS